MLSWARFPKRIQRRVNVAPLVQAMRKVAHGHLVITRDNIPRTPETIAEIIYSGTLALLTMPGSTRQAFALGRSGLQDEDWILL